MNTIKMSSYQNCPFYSWENLNCEFECYGDLNNTFGEADCDHNCPLTFQPILIIKKGIVYENPKS